VVKHGENNLIGRSRLKWEDKITKDRKGIGWDIDGIYLA
jgi:hypothetical protein